MSGAIIDVMLRLIHAATATPRSATLAVLAASLAYGTFPWFARTLGDDGMSPQAVAMFRFAVTALVLARFLPFGLPGGVERTASVTVVRRRTALVWALGAGAGMGFGFLSYIWALGRAPVAAVGVIYLTYPLFTVLSAWLLFGLRPTRRSVLAGGLVVAAAAIAMGSGTAGGSPLVLLVALAAPATFGTSIAILCERLWVLHPLARVGAACLGGTAALAPVVIAGPLTEAHPSSAGGVAALVGLVVCTSLLPMTIWAIAAPVAGAVRSAIAGVIELPALAVTGVLLGEALQVSHAASGALVVVAILIAPSRSSDAPPADVSAGVLQEAARPGDGRRFRDALRHARSTRPGTRPTLRPAPARDTAAV